MLNYDKLLFKAYDTVGILLIIDRALKMDIDGITNIISIDRATRMAQKIDHPRRPNASKTASEDNKTPSRRSSTQTTAKKTCTEVQTASNMKLGLNPLH